MSTSDEIEGQLPGAAWFDDTRLHVRLTDGKEITAMPSRQPWQLSDRTDFVRFASE